MVEKGRKSGTLRFSIKPDGEVKTVMLAGDFTNWKPDERARYSNTFLTKILPFVADATMRAMFGAPEPGRGLDASFQSSARGAQRSPA